MKHAVAMEILCGAGQRQLARMFSIGKELPLQTSSGATNSLHQ
jgi:hypothetical protein